MLSDRYSGDQVALARSTRLRYLGRHGPDRHYHDVESYLTTHRFEVLEGDEAGRILTYIESSVAVDTAATSFEVTAPFPPSGLVTENVSEG